MSRVATTYWDNRAVSVTTRSNNKTVKHRESTSPQWFVFAVVVLMTSMLCLTINMRAFSELNEEIQQNQKLSFEVDQLTNENLARQEEIHNLKTDSRTIEREARKLGMGRAADEKIPVPAN